MYHIVDVENAYREAGDLVFFGIPDDLENLGIFRLQHHVGERAVGKLDGKFFLGRVGAAVAADVDGHGIDFPRLFPAHLDGLRQARLVGAGPPGVFIAVGELFDAVFFTGRPGRGGRGDGCAWQEIRGSGR